MMNKGLNRSKPLLNTDVQKKRLNEQKHLSKPTSHFVKSDSSRTLGKHSTPNSEENNNMIGTASAKINAASSGSDSTHQSTAKNEAQPSTILPKLTVASLGNEEKITKARKLIRTLSALISDGNVISVLSDDVPLPSLDQIHCGVKELESQIDKCKGACASMKTKHEKQVKEMKRLRKERMKAEEVARKKQAEEEQKKMELREQQAQKEFESNLDNAVTEVNENMDKEMKDEDSRLKGEVDEINSAMKAIEEEMEQQVRQKEEELLEKQRISKEVEAAKKSAENERLIVEVEKEYQRAKSELDSSHKMVLSSEKKLADYKKVKVVPVLSSKQPTKPRTPKVHDEKEMVKTENPFKADISPKLQHIMSLTKDDPTDMSNLIKSIYQQNREVANCAHMKALSVIPLAPQKEPVSPPGLVHERLTDIDDEYAIQCYIDHWSKLAREVTGPGNALYTEPSEAPLYKNIEDQYESMKLLVKEHIRGKKRKLHSRWVELAQEYAVRQEKYSKETNINTSSFTSADVGDLPILAQTNDYSPDASGGRSSANPYRRARRNMSGMSGSDVVRSEYEQDLIIAQLKAKENMEKRIKLGGSKLPRQECGVEKVR